MLLEEVRLSLLNNEHLALIDSLSNAGWHHYLDGALVVCR